MEQDLILSQNQGTNEEKFPQNQQNIIKAGSSTQDFPALLPNFQNKAPQKFTQSQKYPNNLNEQGNPLEMVQAQTRDQIDPQFEENIPNSRSNEQESIQQQKSFKFSQNSISQNKKENYSTGNQVNNQKIKRQNQKEIEPNSQFSEQQENQDLRVEEQNEKDLNSQQQEVENIESQNQYSADQNITPIDMNEFQKTSQFPLNQQQNDQDFIQQEEQQNELLNSDNLRNSLQSNQEDQSHYSNQSNQNTNIQKSNQVSQQPSEYNQETQQEITHQSRNLSQMEIDQYNKKKQQHNLQEIPHSSRNLSQNEIDLLNKQKQAQVLQEITYQNRNLSQNEIDLLNKQKQGQSVQEITHQGRNLSQQEIDYYNKQKYKQNFQRTQHFNRNQLQNEKDQWDQQIQPQIYQEIAHQSRNLSQKEIDQYNKLKQLQDFQEITQQSKNLSQDEIDKLTKQKRQQKFQEVAYQPQNLANNQNQRFQASKQNFQGNYNQYPYNQQRNNFQNQGEMQDSLDQNSEENDQKYQSQIQANQYGKMQNQVILPAEVFQQMLDQQNQLQRQLMKNQTGFPEQLQQQVFQQNNQSRTPGFQQIQEKIALKNFDSPINLRESNKFLVKGSNLQQAGDKQTSSLFHVYVVGPPDSGKSSFINRIINPHVFNNRLLQQMNSKYVKYQNTNLQLMFYEMDISHISRINQFGQNNIFIFIYDVAQRSQFNSVAQTINYIINQIKIQDCQDYKILIVGNKIDNLVQRVIQIDEGQQLVHTYSLQGYFDVSVKLNLNLQDITKKLCHVSVNKPSLPNQKQRQTYQTSQKEGSQQEQQNRIDQLKLLKQKHPDITQQLETNNDQQNVFKQGQTFPPSNQNLQQQNFEFQNEDSLEKQPSEFSFSGANNYQALESQQQNQYQNELQSKQQDQKEDSLKDDQEPQISQFKSQDMQKLYQLVDGKFGQLEQQINYIDQRIYNQEEQINDLKGTTKQSIQKQTVIEPQQQLQADKEIDIQLEPKSYIHPPQEEEFQNIESSHIGRIKQLKSQKVTQETQTSLDKSLPTEKPKNQEIQVQKKNFKFVDRSSQVSEGSEREEEDQGEENLDDTLIYDSEDENQPFKLQSQTAKIEQPPTVLQTKEIWQQVLYELQVNNLPGAYARVLQSNDDIYLLKLMSITGPVINQLPQDLQGLVFLKIQDLLISDFLNQIALDWFEQGAVYWNKMDQQYQETVLAAVWGMSSVPSQNGVKAAKLYSILNDS